MNPRRWVWRVVLADWAATDSLVCLKRLRHGLRSPRPQASPHRCAVASGRASVLIAYPEEIRRVIYTTKAIESVNMGLRKTIQNRGSFPNDEASLKLIYLALQNINEIMTAVDPRVMGSLEPLCN